MLSLANEWGGERTILTPEHPVFSVEMCSPGCALSSVEIHSPGVSFFAIFLRPKFSGRDAAAVDEGVCPFRPAVFPGRDRTVGVWRQHNFQADWLAIMAFMHQF